MGYIGLEQEIQTRVSFDFFFFFNLKLDHYMSLEVCFLQKIA